MPFIYSLCVVGNKDANLRGGAIFWLTTLLRAPEKPPTPSHLLGSRQNPPTHLLWSRSPSRRVSTCRRWLDIWRRWYHWALVPATCQGELPLPGVVKAIKHVVCSFVIPDTKLIYTWLLSCAGNKSFVELVLKVEDCLECLYCLFLLFVFVCCPGRGLCFVIVFRYVFIFCSVRVFVL